jgi:uncharacterized membrane protein
MWLNSEEEGPDNPFEAGRRFSKNIPLSLLKQPATASDEQTKLLPFPNTALQLPHLYFPQTAGIGIGRWLSQPIIVQFYLGRLFNLLVWLFLSYLAIKIAPSSKWLLLLLALTPTSLLQSSSLSADALTNGLSVLLIASVLRCAYGEREEKMLVAVTCLLSLLVAVSKAYFGLVLLFLLIVKRQQEVGNRYWPIFATLLAVTAPAVFLWFQWMKNYAAFQVGVSPGEQLSFLLRHPAGYLSTLGHTVMLNGGYYVESFSGRLGHFSLSLPLWIALLHAGVLALVAVLDNTRSVVMMGIEKVLLAVVFLLSSLWVFTSQYLSWTRVGSPLIEGVQGRYFIPLAPLFFLLFYNNRFTLGLHAKKIHSAVALYTVLLLCFSSYVILRGYY